MISIIASKLFILHRCNIISNDVFMPSCEIPLGMQNYFYSRQLEQDTIQQQRDIAAEQLANGKLCQFK